MAVPRISLLIPSRARTELLGRMIASVRAVSVLPVEIVVRIDADDPQLEGYRQMRAQGTINVLVEGPRIVMSDLWNDAARHALADVMMLCGDDLVFKTPGWDRLVMDYLDPHPDKIVLVYGGDGHHTVGYATHPLIHRRWYEAVGKFTGPYFSSDYADTWLWDVSGIINRRQYLPFLTEHMHYSFGKGVVDQTMQENLDRRKRDNPDALYKSKAAERKHDAERLQAAIDTAKAVPRTYEVVCAYPAEPPPAPRLSILIPTLPQRKHTLALLLNSLTAQLAGLDPAQVEILTLSDSGELTVGVKRNQLLAAARGDYVMFWDDDDRAFGDAMRLILDGLRADIDCLALTVLTTFDDDSGKWPPRLDRLAFDTAPRRQIDCGIHICPVRRSIAQRVPFDSVSWGEDRNWSIRVKPLIKTWATIAKPVYHYDFNTTKTETQKPGAENHALDRGALRPGRLARPPQLPARPPARLPLRAAPRPNLQRVGDRPAARPAPVRQRLASDNPTPPRVTPEG